MNRKMSQEMKRIVYRLMMMLTIAFALFIFRDCSVLAGTDSDLVNVKNKTIVLVEPEDGSDVLVTYNPGETVYITGMTNDGWYTVYYRGSTGYFRTSEMNNDAGNNSKNDTENYNLEEVIQDDPNLESAITEEAEQQISEE